MAEVKVEESRPIAPGEEKTPAAMPPAAPSEPELKIEDIITPEVLNEILTGYNRPELELVDFEGKQGTIAGDNYMSIMYQVKINLRNKNTGSTEQLPVMLKVLPRNEFRKKMIQDCNIFVRDVSMYEKIIPAMEEFQKEAGLSEQEIITPWPKCYACKTDGKEDYLAMEDLKANGYSMANRKVGLDIDHCKLVLTTMAKYHAISYGMFQGDFDKILEKYPWLEEIMFREDKVPDTFKGFMQHTYNQQATMLREAGEGKGAVYVEKIMTDDYFKDMYELVGGKVKWAVIGHGDCWTNNFLFRYDDETKKPIDVKFVDFQVTRASSRCIDIHYFLYTSPPIQILNDKEEELEQLYFEEFTKFAKRLGVDVDAHDLTKENFQRELDKFRYYGAVTGLMLSMIISADQEDVPEMENIKEEDFEEVGKNFFLNMMKENAMKKVSNIAANHLPRCEQMMKNF